MALRIDGNGHGNGKGRNGNGRNGNGNGWSPAKVGILVLAIALVAVLAWRQLDRITPKATVWVASANLEAGSSVTADDLEEKRMREGRVPDDAVPDRSQVEGRKLARGKSEGEPFQAADFEPVSNGAPRLAELLPEGRVLVRAEVLLDDVFIKGLRRGDRFEVLASYREGTTRLVAHDAHFMAWLNPELLRENREGRERDSWLADIVRLPDIDGSRRNRSRTTMLLALRPGDVVPLTAASASGAWLTVALHGQKELDSTGPTWLTQAPEAGTEVEMIAGADREHVQFVR